MAILTGTAGDDKYPNGTELRGTNGDDQIYGLAGSDSLVGFDGDDLLEGSAGADELWGGYGFDYASYQGSPGRPGEQDAGASRSTPACGWPIGCTR